MSPTISVFLNEELFGLLERACKDESKTRGRIIAELLRDKYEPQGVRSTGAPLRTRVRQ